MSKEGKIAIEEKIRIIELYLSGKIGNRGKTEIYRSAGQVPQNEA